ncbi:MAG TPA: hypothetical protein P5320_02055 [Bacteroidales bacterium]|nr:hypothetical protein [Bacteroidales bacterium]HRT78832.1 hypothetical protein [Paludibacteraceae bacterium]HOK73778.1 hypothetical protein [Bacteroidales bacterium]HOM39379.1 hypothetical protein [Bacteroidales bacterium]HPP91488.1 hypothetical protein [Bacteroidales bacterium]
MDRKVHQTQWAEQFDVAHEMTRRGYLVAFTMGNAPTTDLLCKSPHGIEFSVQVKSLRSKNYFLYQDSLINTSSNLFFVFVLVPTTIGFNNLNPPEYFVLNKQQFLKVVEEENYRLKEEEKRRGRPFAKFSPGINYRTINKDEFRNAWHNLPA